MRASPRTSTNSMPYGILFLLLVTVCCTRPAAADWTREPGVPGVGFGLTANYGTASVYLANGSSINIAKIEGNAAYKAFMRSPPSAPINTTAAGSPPASYLAHAQTRLCRRLDALPWLPYDPCPPTPAKAAVQPMLRGLKTAVESHLGTTICFAEMVAPQSLNEAQRSVILRALAALDMQTMEDRILSDAAAAVVAQPPGVDFEGTILALDYSRSGMAAALSRVEDGVMETLRSEAWPELGADAEDVDTVGHWERVKAALRDFVGVEGGTGGADVLFTYGDSTEMEPLRAILSDVLGPEAVVAGRESREQQRRAGMASHDPVFASAVVAARRGSRMNEPDFPREPSWTCMFRSALYPNTWYRKTIVRVCYL